MSGVDLRGMQRRQGELGGSNDAGDATGSTGSNSCFGEQQATTEECQDYVKDPEISNFPDESVSSETLFGTITSTYVPGHSWLSVGNLGERYKRFGAPRICIKTKLY